MPGWDEELASGSTLTFDLQLALHLSFTQVVDGLAGVHAAIVGAGLPDLQGTHPLVAKHAVAWVVNDGDLVLHPDDFGLQQFVFKQCCLMWIYTRTCSLLAPVYPTYPRVRADAAVQSGVVASDSKRINQWLRELRSLFEVMIFEFLQFHLQSCTVGRGTCSLHDTSEY